MNLAEVLQFLAVDSAVESKELRHISIDSRRISAGDLFVAVPGDKFDGRNFIDQALSNGAAAVLVEAPFIHPSAISVPNLKTRLAQLAAFFYGYPTKQLKVIGITGTNGKTSCSHYIAQLFAANNMRCGIMGTLGNGTLGNLSTSQLTTSDCCTIQRQFADFVQQGIEYVAMEVTSIALVQDRVDGIEFDTAVFTNLTQDHLDYHHNMQDYFAAKTILFTKFSPKNSIVNLDDSYAARLLTLIPSSSKITTYSLENSAADVCLSNYKMNSPLIGKFNLSNLLACFAVCSVYGLADQVILHSITKLIPVPGRMQLVDNRPGLPKVVVDYAHTPDALVKALQTLAEYQPQNLYCVFGCGGDRDRTKRPLMLNAALQYSDQVVVTMDNPRTEAPEQIVADILEDKNNSKISVEYDRAVAIKQTIARAGAKDFILIAGKGHEDYQIIGTEKLPFSDVLIAQQELNNRS